MTEPTEAELDAAHLKLDAAIREYRETTNPGGYVVSWFVITETDSLETTAGNIGYIPGPGTTFVQSRGLVDIAHTAQHINQGGL